MDVDHIKEVAINCGLDEFDPRVFDFAAHLLADSEHVLAQAVAQQIRLFDYAAELSVQNEELKLAIAGLRKGKR